LAFAFLDTSPLAKLYHEEPGSEYVERFVSQSGSKGIISRRQTTLMPGVRTHSPNCREREIEN